MSFDDFIAKWKGKKVDYDGAYRYQCVDLIKQYNKDVFGKESGALGNAIKYVERRGVLKDIYDYIPNSATGNPKKGDVIIYSYAPVGHIAIVISSTLVGATILEQNGGSGSGSGIGTNAIRKTYRPHYKVVGWLRPKENNMYKNKTARQWHDLYVKWRGYRDIWKKRAEDARAKLAEATVALAKAKTEEEYLAVQDKLIKVSEELQKEKAEPNWNWTNVINWLISKLTRKDKR